MSSHPRSYEGILEQQRDLLNHINNPTLNGGADHILGTMDKVQSHDEETQGSGSGSGISDLSALENETDDFGRLLLQHQRDARRLNNAVRGGREQAFRKARPKPRVAERLEREEREREWERERWVNGRDHERKSSGESYGVEPPVTVPREWGRRARKQTDWLKGIVAPSESGEERAEDAGAANGDAIYQHRTTYTGDFGWRGMAEEPLPSIETTTPPMRRYRDVVDTPSSLNHMNTTLKPGAEFEEEEDQDFSAASFLASTPAPTRYHRKIDELARREIEELENQAVATRTLEQIDRRSPNATLRKTSSSRLRERAIADSLLSPSTSPAKLANPSKIPIRRSYAAGSDKENVPLNGEVNGDVKAEALVERKIPSVNVRDARQRPGHRRDDSMNLLKKLARVSSMSPSPARPRSEPSDMEDRKEDVHVVGKERMGMNGVRGETGKDPRAQEQSRLQDQSDRPKSEPTESGIQGYVQWKPEQGAFVETEPHVLQNQPQKTKNSESVIDTFQTAVEEDEQASLNTKELADEAQINTIVEAVARLRPEYPKSALEAIVREAKAERETPQFGESTIQSLEDILHPDLEPTDPAINFDFDAAKAAVKEKEYLEDDEGGKPLTQEEKDRRQEDLAMEAMNKHLRTARTSIKDAHRGLRRVGNKMDTATTTTSREDPTTFHSSHPPPTTKPPSGTVTNTNQIYCPNCGNACHPSLWKALWLELRNNFYTYDPYPRYRYFSLRPTRLGTLTFLWLLWLFTESTLCLFYCLDPRYYTPAPIFPFVIPFLILQPLTPLWNPAWQAFKPWWRWAWPTLYEDVFGEEALEWRILVEQRGAPARSAIVETAFASAVTEWAAAGATETALRIRKSVLDAVDAVGERMWSEELLRRTWED